MAPRSSYWDVVLCRDEHPNTPAGAAAAPAPVTTPAHAHGGGGGETMEAANMLMALHTPNAAASRAESKAAFSCKHCNKQFKRKGDLKRHVRRVHEKIRDSFCPICRQAFGEDYNMRRHVNRVHSRFP